MIPRAFFWLSFLNLLMPGRTHQRNWSTNNQMNDSAGVISYDYYPNTTTTWEPIKIPRVFVSFSVVVAGAVYFKVTSYGVILPFDFSTQWAVFPSAAAPYSYNSLSFSSSSTSTSSATRLSYSRILSRCSFFSALHFYCCSPMRKF